MSVFAIVALTLAGVLVVGGGIAAGVMIYSQQQQLNRLTELMREGDAPGPGAADAEARAAAVSDLEWAISSVEDTFVDTAGRVSDETVRDALRSALNSGIAILDDPDASVEQLVAASVAIFAAAGVAADGLFAAWEDINGTWCQDSDCVIHQRPDG